MCAARTRLRQPAGPRTSSAERTLASVTVLSTLLALVHARPFDEHHHQREPPVYNHLQGQNPVAWPHTSPRHGVTVDVDVVSPGTAFTAAYLGTNIPSYSPHHQVEVDAVPMLEAAGIRVWRWPGGSTGNYWCPTLPGEKWDSCFNEFPNFKHYDAYPTSTGGTHLDAFILLCKKHKCTPMLQINSGIALKYNPSKCSEYVIKMLQVFFDNGIDVKYLEFGNEMYGKWSAPWDDGGYRWNGADYGRAYTAVRNSVRNHFPNKGLLFGMVVNTDGIDWCSQNHICRWNDDILQQTFAGQEADWITVHRYFTDWGEEAMYDRTILGSGPGGLDQILGSLQQHWQTYLRRQPPPIALTEYSPVFMRSEACGAAQQYISFLWQAKFIGDAVWRGKRNLVAMNHFAARATIRPCQTWGAGLKRAPSDSYGLYAKGGESIGAEDGTPFPVYYAFVMWNYYGGNVLHSATTKDDVSVYVTSWTPQQRCGNPNCTSTVLETTVTDAESCEEKIDYLRSHREHKELAACRAVAIEYKKVCGACMPPGGAKDMRETLGVIIVNERGYEVSVTLKDVRRSRWFNEATGHQIRATGHVFSPAGSAGKPSWNDRRFRDDHDPLYKLGIKINGHQTKDGFGGPFPLDEVLADAYHTTLRVTNGQVRIGVPALSAFAVALHSDTYDPPSPPPKMYPPPPCPNPPPPRPPPPKPPPTPAPPPRPPKAPSPPSPPPLMCDEVMAGRKNILRELGHWCNAASTKRVCKQYYVTSGAFAIPCHWELMAGTSYSYDPAKGSCRMAESEKARCYISPPPTSPQIVLPPPTAPPPSPSPSKPPSPSPPIPPLPPSPSCEPMRQRIDARAETEPKWCSDFKSNRTECESYYEMQGGYIQLCEWHRKGQFGPYCASEDSPRICAPTAPPLILPPSPIFPPPAPPPSPPHDDCSFGWGRINIRLRTPPQWCFELSKDKCDNAYVMSNDRPVMKSPCQWDQGRNGCYSSPQKFCPGLPSEPLLLPEERGNHFKKHESWYRDERSLERVEELIVAETDFFIRESLNMAKYAAAAMWISEHEALPAVEAALEAAEAKKPPQLLTLVVYNLPNRDCGGASSGEYCCEGGKDGEPCKVWADATSDCAPALLNYKAFISAVSATLGRHPDVPVSVILEPDALGMLATDGACNELTLNVFRKGLVHAVHLLSPFASVYVDAGHGKWLSYASSLRKVAKIVAELELHSFIRGFSTNVANYQPLGRACEDIQTETDLDKLVTKRRAYCASSKGVQDQCCHDPCGVIESYGLGNGELNYVLALRLAMMQKISGFTPHFVIDTSRNGNPYARTACENWCNIRDAGLGRTPTAATALPDVVDAYVWAKVPGESDGCSNKSCTGFADNCISADAWASERPGALADEPDAPHAGQFFAPALRRMAFHAVFMRQACSFRAGRLNVKADNPDAWCVAVHDPEQCFNAYAGWGFNFMRCRYDKQKKKCKAMSNQAYHCPLMLPPFPPPPIQPSPTPSPPPMPSPHPSPPSPSPSPPSPAPPPVVLNRGGKNGAKGQKGTGGGSASLGPNAEQLGASGSGVGIFVVVLALVVALCLVVGYFRYVRGPRAQRLQAGAAARTRAKAQLVDNERLTSTSLTAGEGGEESQGPSRPPAAKGRVRAGKRIHPESQGASLLRSDADATEQEEQTGLGRSTALEQEELELSISSSRNVASQEELAPAEEDPRPAQEDAALAVA